MAEHPITPSLELVQQWTDDLYGGPGCIVSSDDIYLATRAAQWGADEELAACVDSLFIDQDDIEAAGMLRAARRPQPASLKERALEAARIELCATGKNGALIIRALEQLP